MSGYPSELKVLNATIRVKSCLLFRHFSASRRARAWVDRIAARCERRSELRRHPSRLDPLPLRGIVDLTDEDFDIDRLLVVALTPEDCKACAEWM